MKKELLNLVIMIFRVTAVSNPRIKKLKLKERKNDHDQFSSNNIHTSSGEKVIRIKSIK